MLTRSEIRRLVLCLALGALLAPLVALAKGWRNRRRRP
jgi:hypothetical protein